MAQGKRVQKKKKSQNKNTAKIAIIAVALIVVIMLAVIAGTSVYISGLNTVYPNVCVSGVNVGGMTFSEAYEALSEIETSSSGDVDVNVILTDAVSLTLTSSDVGYTSDITDVVNMAINYGKDGNLMSQVLTFLKCTKSKTELEAEGALNETLIREKIAGAAQLASHDAAGRQYTISDTAITIVKGSSGYVVDEDAVYDYVIDIFKNNTSGSFETDEFSEKYASASGDDTYLDLDAIYNEVYVEPVNAVYDASTGTTVDGVTGVSFDLVSAKAEYEKLGNGETMVIDLIFTEPDVITENLEELLFRDKLAEKATTLSTSTSNRITNVTLAAEACNDTILQPGDTFSFNGVVGERTTAKGYKEAGAYVAGETVDQVGGGICQVSSTLYYCALMANLEITSRTNHMYSVAYLPLGFDATVNWGTIDFKFTNDTDYPVKIVAYVENKQLYMELWGTKLDDSYVELKYDLVQTLEYETVEQEDESIEQGKTKVKSSGHNGYVVDNYQLVYDGDGNLLENNYLGRSTYKTQTRVILVAPAVEEVDTPTEGEETSGEGEGEETPPTGTDTPDTPDAPEPPDAEEPAAPSEGEEIPVTDTEIETNQETDPGTDPEPQTDPEPETDNDDGDELSTEA